MMQPASLAAADSTIGQWWHLSVPPSGQAALARSAETDLRPLTDTHARAKCRIMDAWSSLRDLLEGEAVHPSAPSSVDPHTVAEAITSVEHSRIAELEQALRDEVAERRRTECMAHIQDQAVQLALGL